jgi:hypothetical protein
MQKDSKGVVVVDDDELPAVIVTAFVLYLDDRVLRVTQCNPLRSLSFTSRSSRVTPV